MVLQLFGCFIFSLMPMGGMYGHLNNGGVAKLEDAPGLDPGGLKNHEGSSPFPAILLGG